MPELNHVVFVVEPDDEAPSPGPGEPVPVLVVAELGYEASDDVLAATDRVAALDPRRPAEPQVLELLSRELLEDLAHQAAEAGIEVDAEELRPHIQVAFSAGADDLFPDE